MFDTWSVDPETSAVVTWQAMKLAAGGKAVEREARGMVAEKIGAALSLQTLALTGGLGMTPQSAARKSLRITGAGCLPTGAGWLRNERALGRSRGGQRD